MIDRGGELLGLAERMPLGELPAPYRFPMRRYLATGALPAGELRLVLEGDVGAALARVRTDAERLAVCRLSSWVLGHLPAFAHGNPDQVQLFVVYVRRARGRALLASMDGAA